MEFRNKNNMNAAKKFQVKLKDGFFLAKASQDEIVRTRQRFVKTKNSGAFFTSEVQAQEALRLFKNDGAKLEIIETSLSSHNNYSYSQDE